MDHSEAVRGYYKPRRVAATVLADGSRRPLVEVARALVARLLPVARDLGDDAALAGVERILVEGGAAERRRADVARADVEKMLAAAIPETHMSAELGAGTSVSRRWLDVRIVGDEHRRPARCLDVPAVLGVLATCERVHKFLANRLVVGDERIVEFFLGHGRAPGRSCALARS